MRLGQLARKLSLRPQEILDFLGSRQITIEEGSNTRLEEIQVEMIVQHFAPFSTPAEVASVTQEADDIIVPVPEEPIPVNATAEMIQDDVVDEPLPVELIKAPKVELQGLKVLGKIELPESKKKSEIPLDSPPDAGPATPVKRTANEDRKSQQKRSRPSNRSDKNPIALAREREAQDARRRKDEAQENAKEQRTKNYYKKVKVAAPTKQARLIEDQFEEIAQTDAAAPAGWWGKMKRWFSS